MLFFSFRYLWESTGLPNIRKSYLFGSHGISWQPHNPGRDKRLLFRDTHRSVYFKALAPFLKEGRPELRWSQSLQYVYTMFRLLRNNPQLGHKRRSQAAVTEGVAIEGRGRGGYLITFHLWLRKECLRIYFSMCTKYKHATGHILK